MSLQEAVGDDRISERLIQWLHGASIEVVPLGQRAVERLRTQFDPGTEVFVNFLPNGRISESIRTARALNQAGFKPIPHVAARALGGRAELDELVARLVGEAEIDRVLAIAGDTSTPRGEFSSTLDLLQSGVLEKRGVRSVGIAGHPEDHPLVDRARLESALVAKRDYAAEHGLELFVVTQFCFEADPICLYLDRLGELGVDAPVRIGVAGPATLPVLIRYAIHCGIGASLRNIRLKTQTVGQLIGDSDPDELLRELATRLDDAADGRDISVHFYPFGGSTKTSRWIAATQTILYDRVARAR